MNVRPDVDKDPGRGLPVHGYPYGQSEDEMTWLDKVFQFICGI